jgi:hypothetical protein
MASSTLVLDWTNGWCFLQAFASAADVAAPESDWVFEERSDCFVYDASSQTTVISDTTFKMKPTKCYGRSFPFGHELYNEDLIDE